MMKKYVVVPGYVKSQVDGGTHYISGEKLIQLYGVDKDDCAIVIDEHEYNFAIYRLGLIPLEPDPTGKYDITGTGEKFDMVLRLELEDGTVIHYTENHEDFGKMILTAEWRKINQNGSVVSSQDAILKW